MSIDHILFVGAEVLRCDATAVALGLNGGRIVEVRNLIEALLAACFGFIEGIGAAAWGAVQKVVRVGGVEPQISHF